jgi:hypothetical protein
MEAFMTIRKQQSGGGEGRNPLDKAAASAAALSTPYSDEPLVVSPRRAQQMLDIGHSRIYELIAAGELRTFKDGKSRKIVVASIRDFVARKLAGAQPSQTAPPPAPLRRRKTRAQG